VVPANVPFAAARVKSCRVATTWLFGQPKNAGPNEFTVTVSAALVPAAFPTVTGCGPDLSSGDKSPRFQF
jgi:hypothetical protein